MIAITTNIKHKVLLVALTLSIAVFAALVDTNQAHAAILKSGSYGPYGTSYPAYVQCGYMNANVSFTAPDARPAQGRAYQWVAWRPVIYIYNFSQSRWEVSKYGTWQAGWAYSGTGPAVNGYWSGGATSLTPGFVYKVAADIKWYNSYTGTWDGRVVDWYNSYWNQSTTYCDFR